MNIFTRQEPSTLFFDDFNIETVNELTQRGWVVADDAQQFSYNIPQQKQRNQYRNNIANWRADQISLVDLAGEPEKRVVELFAKSDGTWNRHSQFCQPPRFAIGTFSARVKLNNSHNTMDGDALNKHFLLNGIGISQQSARSKHSFTYEQRPGYTHPILINEQLQYDTKRSFTGDQPRREIGYVAPGWYQLTIQFNPKATYCRRHNRATHCLPTVRFFLDDEQVSELPIYTASLEAKFGMTFAHYYPSVVSNDYLRVETMQIDWVYHAPNILLRPNEIRSYVDEHRRAHRSFIDTTATRVIHDAEKEPYRCPITTQE
ncbi:hypothetical protein K4H28_09275 [Deefgea tanakiae]|uniref:Uncharacterized protein n=1 Tax=Deefgea tanakiae TaxID=2865840 RepID=A0ABX8Z1S6_9NEIS|nr:hypothetical protein [Deefgea tanakiae]QZA76527.1 hypothetical protein K4H28_09275 [Deefgea tanakiae]